MEKGVVQKQNNETDPGFPQECVGDYDNATEINRSDGASDRYASANSNVSKYTYKIVIQCKI